MLRKKLKHMPLYIVILIIMVIHTIIMVVDTIMVGIIVVDIIIIMGEDTVADITIMADTDTTTVDDIELK
jgi:hypothetical protein